MIEFMTRYWLEVLFSGALAILGAAYRRLAGRIKEQDAIKLGIQALLRDRMIQMYNHYAEKRYYPIYARSNMHALYEQYHALGGNGTVSELMERLEDMPTQVEFEVKCEREELR